MTLVLTARPDTPVDATSTPVGDDQWQRVVAAITRRDFLVGAGALTVAGLLAACGDGSGQAAGTPAAGGETMPFEHDGYRTDLPLHPERVVVLEARAGLEFALLAGLPIVATEWSDESHLMAHLPAGVERLGGSNIEPNAESILSHSPDMLVVGAGWWKYYQENDSLAEGIAPVLVVGDDDPDWKASLRRQLAAFGREQQAIEAIDAYDATVADVSAEIAPLVTGRKVVIAGADEEGFWIQEPDSFSARASPATSAWTSCSRPPGRATARCRGTRSRTSTSSTAPTWSSSRTRTTPRRPTLPGWPCPPSRRAAWPSSATTATSGSP